MHRSLFGVAAQPHFLGGEAEDRADPADERVEDMIEHRAVRAALELGRSVAVKAVLADVEEEGGEIVIGKGVIKRL
jgi:hypothetical protein